MVTENKTPILQVRNFYGNKYYSILYGQNLIYTALDSEFSPYKRVGGAHFRVNGKNIDLSDVWTDLVSPDKLARMIAEKIGEETVYLNTIYPCYYD